MVANTFAMENSNELSGNVIQIVNEYIVNEKRLLVLANPEILQQKICSYEFDIVIINIVFIN